MLAKNIFSYVKVFAAYRNFNFSNFIGLLYRLMDHRIPAQQNALTLYAIKNHFMAENQQNQDSNTKGIIGAATDLVKAVPVYQDAIRPAAKQIGKSLETVAKTVNIALAPIKALVWGYEKIEEFLTIRVSEKLKNVPEENIVTPLPQVAGPAVEALRFSGHDENIRELFANLIATSMDKETLHKAHPGYVEIIKNLSSDEASLLKVFIDDKKFPLVDFQAKENATDSAFKTLLTNHSHFHQVVAIDRKDLIPSYIDNLNRLGIVNIPDDVFIVGENIYEPLENDEIAEFYKKAIEKHNNVLTFKRRMVHLTSFGENFVDNVVKEKT